MRAHRSYFCSGDKKRFALLVEVIGLSLLGEGQQPCQMRSENRWMLSREVRRKTRGVGFRRDARRWRLPGAPRCGVDVAVGPGDGGTRQGRRCPDGAWPENGRSGATG